MKQSDIFFFQKLFNGSRTISTIVYKGGAQFTVGGAEFTVGGAKYTVGGAEYTVGGAKYTVGGAE